MSRKVNITFGANGQIGSYLCEYLLEKGEETVGVVRRSSINNTERLASILDNKLFALRCADVTDPFSLVKLFNEIIVDKNIEYVIYNLAAMSFVKTSFSQPIISAEITGIGHVNILETLTTFHTMGFKVKLFFNSSSETFGGSINSAGFQNISTPFSPNSPYSAAKLYAYHMNRIYRESYNMFNTSAILFNTESPRRGDEFVTKKITKFFAQLIVDGFKLKDKLKLGNINACRDWTHAKDTVRAIYLIANNLTPKDYIVSSQETHTIKSFIDECYSQAQIILGENCYACVEDLYEIDENLFRPNEVKYLRGDSSVIRHDLGWKPNFNFQQLVFDMLNSDYQKLLTGSYTKQVEPLYEAKT